MKQKIINAFVLSSLLAFCIAYAQTPPPAKTKMEELLEQHTLDLQRLAALSASVASCEANGPQSVQYQKQAQDALAALQKSYADRGLRLRQDGTLESVSPVDKK